MQITHEQQGRYIPEKISVILNKISFVDVKRWIIDNSIIDQEPKCLQHNDTRYRNEHAQKVPPLLYFRLEVQLHYAVQSYSPADHQQSQNKEKYRKDVAFNLHRCVIKRVLNDTNAEPEESCKREHNNTDSV